MYLIFFILKNSNKFKREKYVYLNRLGLNCLVNYTFSYLY